MRTPTRYVRLMILILIVPLAGYVAYSILRGRTPPRSARAAPPISASVPSSEMKKFIFEQTQEGKPLYSLRASRMVGTESNVILLEGIESFDIQRPAGPVRVSADKGKVLTEEGKISAVELEGNVVAQSEKGERFEAPSAKYLAKEKTITAPGPVRFRAPGFSGEGKTLEEEIGTGSVLLAGPVTIRCDQGALAGWTVTAASVSRKSSESPVVLAGRVRFAGPEQGQVAAAVAPGGTEERSLPERNAAPSHQRPQAVRQEQRQGLQGPPAFVGQTSEQEWIEADRVSVGPSVPPTGARFEGSVRGLLQAAPSRPPITFAASRLELSRPAPGSPSRAVLAGQAQLQSQDEQGPMHLQAPEIAIGFDPEGRPHAVEARPEATLVREKKDGQETLQAQEMSFDIEAGRLRTATARGSVRMQTPEGRAGGEQASFAESRISLEGGRPWIRQENRLVVADRLESDSAAGQLRAQGNVHVRLPPAGRGSHDAPSDGSVNDTLPLFASGKPVFVESPDAVFLSASREASFRGGVRAWQEQTSLQAASLDLYQNEGIAHAWGEVVTRGIRQTSAGNQIPYTISAPEMFYEEASAQLRYREGCSYRETGSSLHADEILVDQSQGPAGPGSAGTSPARGRRIERVEALGHVSLISGSRRGTADRAEHLVSENKVTLVGELKPATVDDEAQGRHFEGPALTVDLSTDNIAVLGAGSGERGKVRFAQRGRDASGDRR